MFEFNGMPITLEQVEESAKESNMDIDSYIKKAEKDGLIDKRKPSELGKSTPTTPGAVVEKTAAPVMDSKPENGLSEYTKEGEIILRGEQIDEYNWAVKPVELEEVVITANEYKSREAKAALDFMGIPKMEPKDQGQFLPITEYEETQRVSAGELAERQKQKQLPTTLSKSIANTAGQAMNRFAQIDDYGEYLYHFLLSDTDIVYNIFGEKAGKNITKYNRTQLGKVENKLKTYSRMIEPAYGFTDIDGDKTLAENIKYGAGALINAFANVGSSMAVSGLTFGAGLGLEIVGQTVADHNRKISEITGKNLEELAASGKLEMFTPTAIGVLRWGLEKAGLDKISNSIFNSSTSVLKNIVDLGLTTGANGLQEWFDVGLETINTSLAEGKNLIDAENDAWAFMQSKEGIESFLQGAFGATGFSLAGKGIMAASNIKTKEERDFIAEKVSLFGMLERSKMQKGISEKDIKLITDRQNTIITDLKSSIEKNNKIVFALTENQLNDIDNYSKTLISTSNEIKRINSNNELSDEIKKELILELQQKANQAQNAIYNIRRNAEDVSKGIDKVQQASKYIQNLDIQAFNNADQINDFIEKNNYSEEYKKGSNDYGFIIQDKNTDKQIIIINKEEAAKSRVGVNVANHEFIHALLFQSLKNNPETAINLGKALEEELNRLDPKQIKNSEFKQRLNQYKKDKSIDKATTAEEALTLFSDALKTGDIKIVDDNISGLIRKAIGAIGITAKFDKGQDVLNFIKDINSSLEKGTLTLQQIKIAKGEILGSLISTKTQKQQKRNILKSKASETIKVNQIYEEKGKEGAAEIIEAYKPLTARITNKYKNVPGFDFELLQSEIELGPRGLLDLIQKYDASKGATLNTYIQGQLEKRAIEAANRILDTDFKLDVTEAKGITDTTTEEITEEVIEKPSEKLQSLRKKMNIGDEIKPVVFDAVRKTFGTKLPSVTEKAFKTELEKSFRTELKKPIAKLMGRTEDYRSFLSNNFEAIYDALPQSIINKRLAEFAEPVMKDGKQVREKTAEGNKVFTKKKISKAEWIKYFLGSEVGRSTQGTRKTALAEALSEAFALDATMEVLSDPTVLQKVKDIGELTGVKISDTFIEDVSRLINRPTNLKFSLSTKEKNAIEDITEIYKRDILNTLNSEKVNLIDDLDFYIFERFDKYINENKNLDEILINVTKDINQYIIDEKSKKKIEEKILDVKNGINREYFLNLKAEVGIANQKEIAEIGYSSTTNLLEERLNKANEKDKIKIINDFIKNEAKSITTFNGLKDITKNIDILNKVLNPILKKYNIKGYEIGINPKGRGQSIFFNNQVISKYKSATEIKKSFNDFKDLINKESEEAIEYIINLAEYYKNQNKKNEGLGHIKLLTNDQIGAFRKMGKAGMYVEGLETKRTTLEHQETILSLYNAVQDYFDNKINLKELENILRKSQINLVTKRVDNALMQSGQKSSGKNRMLHPLVIEAVQKDINDGIIYKDIEKVYKNNEIKFSKSTNKKLRVFDFDDTLARSKSNVLYTMPDGTKGKLNAEQFAKQGDDLLQQGAEFDFSEFSKVIEGQKGPMFDVAKAILDKRGDEDLFILTARPAEAKYAIQPFLEGLGLPFRLENIIGLGNGSPQAKADWIASKLNLGYNDVYFADDALKNVEAVAKTLSAYDIKYRSQAVKASKSLNIEFNEILQQSTGVEFYKEYSPVKAELLGRGKGRFKFFVPYDADDFVGLLYTTLGKGKTGDAQMEWYKENLLKPFSRGIQQYEAAKQRALRDWADLKAQIEKDVPAGLNKQNETGFRNQDSVRIYIWHTQGVDMTSKEMGMSKSDLNDNLKYIRNNAALKAFADKLMALNIDGYPDPTTNWTAGDITTDLVSYINDVKRKEYLQPWKDNIDIIFSDKNKNKLKALYGNSYIESLDDMLYRMWNGRNRRVGITKKERAFQDWINNSVGTVMFFNSRSALLQTISAINFINFTDNNPINAAAAFANQKQYWADFSELFNSDFLKQRRSGLQIDINADEIANAAATSRNKAKAALSAILKFGFTPTQIADSFAIASGGATFYRNRINKYLKEGLTQEEAQKKAFEDFQETAEESQQSARPDRISMQQASSLGRTILAWGNTPMQYARIQKKAALDLINGRGDWKTNVSKIMYYGVIQNIIFSALQQGLFALLFSDEEDEKEKERYFRVGNSMLDTFLRGAGIYGAVASTAKNVIMEIIDQAKSSRPDYTQAAIAATTISPPVNSKLRKLISAGKTFTYKQSKEKVFTEGFSLENPAFLAGGQVISAVANIPVDRIVQKADHIYTAMKPETELWQSIALSLGWSEWDLNMIEKQTKKPSTIYKTSKSRGSRKSRNTR